MTVHLFTHETLAPELATLGTTMHLLAVADDTASAYEAVLVDAEYGDDLVPHRHPWEECYYVLEGTLDVLVGRRVRPAGPGTFVTLPSRCVHGYRVTTPSARFLHLSIGSGAVDAFRDLAAFPPEPTAGDLDALLATLARHGIEVLVDPDALRLERPDSTEPVAESAGRPIA